MLLMGDEYGHTRNGNNNAWCQDNDLNWFLWDELEKNREFFRFYQQLIAFRKNHPILQREEFLTSEDIDWHGLEPMKANWGAESRFVACTIKDHVKNEHLYIAFNASFSQAHQAPGSSSLQKMVPHYRHLAPTASRFYCNA